MKKVVKRQTRQPKRFTKDEAKTILSWHGKLQKKPEALREIRLSDSLKDIKKMKETVRLSDRMKGVFDPDTAATMAKILSHVRHSKENYWTLSISNLTKERRENLRNGSWTEILSQVDGKSVNIINLAETVRNWDILSRKI
jgi:hypothetical protein